MDLPNDPMSRELLQLGELIQATLGQLVQARSATQGSGSSTSPAAECPTWEQFSAQRTLLAAAGSLIELVAQPENRLLEVSSQYFEARALHIAADARVPDLLARAGAEGETIDTLSSQVGIEPRKLCKQTFQCPSLS